VAQSLAEAYVEPENAWPRLVYAGSELVAFVMGGFRPDDPFMSSTLWRLNVSAEAQRQGVGRFAVRAVAAEVRRRGHETLTTAYVLGPHSPEAFYLAIGFRPTGRSARGMHEAAIRIDDLLPRHG
jgi:diamine N-acetyltransferase